MLSFWQNYFYIHKQRLYTKHFKFFVYPNLINIAYVLGKNNQIKLVEANQEIVSKENLLLIKSSEQIKLHHSLKEAKLLKQNSILKLKVDYLVRTKDSLEMQLITEQSCKIQLQQENRLLRQGKKELQDKLNIISKEMNYVESRLADVKQRIIVPCK